MGLVAVAPVTAELAGELEHKMSEQKNIFNLIAVVALFISGYLVFSGSQGTSGVQLLESQVRTLESEIAILKTQKTTGKEIPKSESGPGKPEIEKLIDEKIQLELVRFKKRSTPQVVGTGSEAIGTKSYRCFETEGSAECVDFRLICRTGRKTLFRVARSKTKLQQFVNIYQCLE